MKSDVFNDYRRIWLRVVWPDGHAVDVGVQEVPVIADFGIEPTVPSTLPYCETLPVLRAELSKLTRMATSAVELKAYGSTIARVCELLDVTAATPQPYAVSLASSEP